MIKKILKVVLFMTAAAVLVAMTGCRSRKLNEANAKALVGDFLTDYRSLNFDGMYADTHDAHPYFDGMYHEESESNVIMFNALASSLEYEIKSVEIKGSEANVTVHTSNVDVAHVLQNITSYYLAAREQYTDDEVDFDRVFAEITKKCFEDPDNPRVEHDTVFNLIEKDKNWTIESNIMIYDDITGGYMTYYYQNVVFSDLLNSAS